MVAVLDVTEQAQLQKEFPEAFLLSSRDKPDLARLREKILSYFESDMVDADLFIPYHVQGVIGEVRTRARVLGEAYNEAGVTLKIRAYPETLDQFKEKIKKALASAKG